MTSNKLLFALLFSIFTVLPAKAEYNDAVEMINRGDFIGAVEELKPLVDLGYPPALYQQAGLYENGQGVAKNELKAFELYQRAAGRGIAEAQFALAQMYFDGRGTVKNNRQGFEYTRRSAEKGLAAAQFNLALMYQQGDIVPQNYGKAAVWYRDAAMQNYAFAQFNLALLYFEGKGVTENLEESYIWNRVAAFNGHKDAETSMNMDSKKLSRNQIKRCRDKADALYLKIAPEVDNYKPFTFDG